MTDRGPIVFIDSGVGGLPYLDWVRKERPGWDYAYVADPRNFPYGTKPPERIVAIVAENFGAIVSKFNPSMVVIACNTATVHALAKMRELHSFPIVGVVPAVKPAAITSPNRRIGILATERTVGAAYLDNLVREFASGCAVFRAAAGNIVDYVENRYFSRDDGEMFSLMEEALSELRRNRVDAVVLGCTHFLYMDKAIGDYMGPEVSIIDSREGVGRQVIRQAERFSLPIPARERPRFYSTGGLSADAEEHYRQFAGMFDLEWMGSL